LDDLLHRFLFLEARAARAGCGEGTGPAIDNVKYFLVEDEADLRG
jgi:hypothetical protein